MRKIYFPIAVLLIVLFVIGVLLTRAVPKTKNTNNPTEKALPTINYTTVTLTSAGFDPASITIKPGETIKWINKSGGEATVNSDPYPKNDLYPFMNQGIFANESSIDIKFEKAGTYTYHNQLKPTQRGTVVVK